MRNWRSISLVLIFALCLLVSFLGGRALNQHAADWIEAAAKYLSTRKASGSQKTAANGQRNILVVAVDRLGAPTPRLEGVWIILFTTASPELTLLPLYPASLEGGPAEDAFLEKTFRMTPGHNLDPAFLAALQEEDLWWSNTLVLDEFALAELIDLAGGNTQGKQVLTGIRTVANIPQAWVNPRGALSGQEAALSKLCQARLAKSPHKDPNEFFELLKPHMSTDLRPEQAFTDWKKLFSSDQSLWCTFPVTPQGISQEH